MGYHQTAWLLKKEKFYGTYFEIPRTNFVARYIMTVGLNLPTKTIVNKYDCNLHDNNV